MKKYINSITIREKTFDNGGSALNVSINIEKFNKEATEFITEKGYITLNIARRKEKGKYDETHFAYIYIKDEEENKKPKLMETKKDDDELPF
jgi:hypothetical protein